MQRLEVSGAVRLIYRSLGVKGLITGKHLPKYTVSHPGTLEVLEYLTLI